MQFTQRCQSSEWILPHVLQLHVVDAQTGEVTRHKLRRDRVNRILYNRQKSLVAMEVCGGAHHFQNAADAGT